MIPDYRKVQHVLHGAWCLALTERKQLLSHFSVYIQEHAQWFWSVGDGGCMIPRSIG